MSASNRSALFAKTHKILRKHYEPVSPPSDRSVLEHLLYACVLENGKHEAVDDVFARLQKNYFDWNEIRVTSVPELAEVMANIPDAVEAAKRMKRALQSVFETHYVFDIDFLKKQGLGKTIEVLQKFNGVTPFVIDYVTQNALGGHAIPVNTSAMELLVLLGAISEADAAKNRAPGLERTIPKNKGVEFASLLHQFAVDFAANPQGPKVKGIIHEIDPSAKDRMPKKIVRPPAAEPPATRKRPTEASPPEMRGQKADKSSDKERPKKPRAEEPGESESKTKVAAARITRKKPK